MINFETYHEVRRLSRELNLTPAQIAAKSGLNIKTIRKWLDKPYQQAGSLQRSNRLLVGKTSLYRNAGFSAPAL
jgi:hypothetical protein